MKNKHLITGLILTSLVSVLVWLGIRKCGCVKTNIDKNDNQGEKGEEHLEVKVLLE
jgi:hypothetical protein